jgi:hypothetical protein
MPIQHKRGSLAAWLASPFVLAPGQMGVAPDAGEVRVGNGVDTWTNLHPPREVALAGKVAKGELFTNLRDFPVVGDGVADDTAAVQAAATAAATAGRTLFVPAGTYRLTARVDVTTSMVCDGVFTIDTSNTTASIRFARALAPVVLTTAALGGLTSGSNTITGLAGALGTLALTSTDHVIERNNGVGQFYVKAETQQVVNELGGIVPPLNSTYSVATLTATLYPDEAPLIIDRLRVTLTGTTALPANDHYVGVYRSNVTLNDLQVHNPTAGQPVSAVRTQSAANVTLNTPKIHGFDQAGAGYGIAVYSSSNVVINNGNVTRCRHTVSGLNNKVLTVDGGSYDGAIDTHWGSDLRLLNLSVNVAAGLSCVGVAGKNVTVDNCTFTGGRTMVGIRADSPELDGTVSIQNSRWSPAPGGTLAWIVGVSSPTLAYFDFGRVVLNPKKTLLRNIVVTMPDATATLYAVYGSGNPVPQTYWADIEIDRVRVSGGAGWAALTLDKDGANHATDTKGTVAAISNLDFTTGPGVDNVYINNTGDVTDAKGFDLTVTSCLGVYMKVPENGMVSVVVRNSTVRRLYRTVASASPVQGAYLFTGNVLEAMAFNGYFVADFRDNLWTGAAASTQMTTDQRAKSYKGNRHAVGATGFPALTDGYTSATYYQTQAVTPVVATPPNIQLLTGSGSYTVPAGAKLLSLVAMGGGGGGGAGRRSAPATLAAGGGGGAGGAMVDLLIDVADLPSGTIPYVCGVGGTGAPAVTLDDTSGNTGGLGGVTTFGNPPLVTASIGSAGGGGTTVTGTAATAATGRVPGSAGGNPAGGTAGNPPTTAGGPGSGASGGGLSVTNVAFNGGASGQSRSVVASSAAGGVVDGALPGAASTPALKGQPGSAGGGGAAGLTGGAQAGGAGAGYGAGGAGGGASRNTYNSGAGADGRPGCIYVVATF